LIMTQLDNPVIIVVIKVKDPVRWAHEKVQWWRCFQQLNAAEKKTAPIPRRWSQYNQYILSGDQKMYAEMLT
jgi:hypothetical protein